MRRLVRPLQHSSLQLTFNALEVPQLRGLESQGLVEFQQAYPHVQDGLQDTPSTAATDSPIDAIWSPRQRMVGEGSWNILSQCVIKKDLLPVSRKMSSVLMAVEKIREHQRCRAKTRADSRLMHSGFLKSSHTWSLCLPPECDLLIRVPLLL